jgi:hypothetical protein
MKKKFALAILILTALVMLGCSSDSTNHVENNPSSTTNDNNSWLSSLGSLIKLPVLFGVAEGYSAEELVKGTSGGNWLYWINTVTGAATPIGYIGYDVEGIAYDAVTNKLYGITSGLGTGRVETTSYASQLIEIDMATGEGSLIGTITPNKKYYSYFSNPSFNSTGTLYAWNNDTEQLCTIDLTTAEADCSKVNGDGYTGADMAYRGQAFNNTDVLYLIVPGAKSEVKYKSDDDDDSSGGARIYAFDMGEGQFNYLRTVHGLPYDMAPNGDFDPVTGLYWGINSLNVSSEIITPDDDDDLVTDDDDDYTSGKSLLTIDVNDGTLKNTIPTIGTLHAVTFGYLGAGTLMQMGLNELISFLKPHAD